MTVSRLGHPGAAAGTGQLVPLRSRTGGALITATVLASATTAVDANVIKVAVPAIGKGLGAGVAALQWTVTSYLLAVAALLLLAGALSDRLGRRRVLIAARVGQGIGAALVVTQKESMATQEES